MTLADTLMQAVQLYDSAAREHPHATSIGTGVVTFGLSDVIAQTITNGKVQWRRAAFNAGMGAPYGEILKQLVDSAALPASVGLDSPFEKAALGPNLWGLGFNALYYLNAVFADSVGYDPVRMITECYGTITQGQDGARANGVRDACRNVAHNTLGRLNMYELEKAALGSLTAWNAIHTANYYVVPERYRTPLTLASAVVWTTLLAMWSRRQGTSSVLNTPVSELWQRWRGRAA